MDLSDLDIFVFFFYSERHALSFCFPRVMHLCDTRSAQTVQSLDIILAHLLKSSAFGVTITRLATDSSWHTMVEMSVSPMARFWLLSTDTIPKYIQANLGNNLGQVLAILCRNTIMPYRCELLTQRAKRKV